MNETRASVVDFDLDLHAVVEASAGTGKTYTIEQLVLRLLREENLMLDQILVVTFTEKATGELKVRLRGMLEREIASTVEPAPNLHLALEQFDQAPIFTIHAFCQRLLQDYALEQGRDFQAELTSDGELLRSLLREVQRKHWRAHFGDRLRDVLEAASYNRETANVWEDRVLSIAMRYKPRAGHRLSPAPVPDWWRRLGEIGADWTGQLEIFTIEKLHQLLRDHKRQRGLQSFDDMIAAVEENLDPAKNPAAEGFLNLLRERYRRGIVDEFQDTDPLQWRIFHNIFLAGGTSKLFIVGDPKQAIYGFRGSDLPTYQQAAEEMKSAHGAAEYPLVVNWRSEIDLLEALNCLFGDGDWFPPETKITYHPVHAPDDDVRLTHVEDDRTNRAALTIVDVSAHNQLKRAHKHLARFMAHEIKHLLKGDAGQPLLSFAHKNQPPRVLRPGDICILVVKRAEAEPITQALDLVGVPYNFYKQTGLWQSEEAIHLELLLETLARPDDRAAFRKALLTFFFRIEPQNLARVPDVPSDHPARQLYQTWLAFVEHRQWSSLCRSLLEDTGLLVAPNEASTGPNLATLRNLLTNLEQAAHAADMDLLAILGWLRDLRAKRDTGDADLVPAGMSKECVQIMTIHASKGLEFPVVFLGGGFTQGSGWKGPVTYRDDAGHLVFELRKDEDAIARAKLDQLSEQRRLLYVALTRPILKLYVPKVRITSRSRRHAGPVGTILLPALEQACPDKLSPLIAEIVTPPLVTAPGDNVAATAPESTLNAPPIALAGPLFSPHDVPLKQRRIFMRSFSSMARHHLSQVGEGASFGEEAAKPTDEIAALAESDDPLRGPVFGDMVHNVLEEIDFAEVGRARTWEDLCRPGAHARKCIDRMVEADITQIRSRIPIDQLEEAARRQVAQLVWHGLKTPLAALGGPMCDIPKADRLHEVEFLFAEESMAKLAEGFITGFMDVLFRKNGRYYLLDWKTNLLPGYSREHIERSMGDSDYHRQYRLYLHATARWLRRALGPRFSFRDSFGGVYYLYLRGMNGRNETSGVYFHVPELKELDLKSLLYPSKNNFPIPPEFEEKRG